MFSVYLNIDYYDYEMTTGYKTNQKGYFSYLNDEFQMYADGHPNNFGDEVRVLYDKEEPKYGTIVEEKWTNFLFIAFFVPVVLAGIFSVIVIIKKGSFGPSEGFKAGAIIGLYGGGLPLIADYRFVVAGFIYDIIYKLFHLF